MAPAQQLEQLFGTSFSPQSDIPTLRQFHANNAYCTDEEGNITGICFCENEREEIVIPDSLSKLQYLNLSDNAKLRRLLLRRLCLIYGTWILATARWKRSSCRLALSS